MAEIVVAPRARYMIVCDEILLDPQRQGKLLIVGLTSLVNWPAGTTTPVRLEKLAVLLILTDGRGAGRGGLPFLHGENRGAWVGLPGIAVCLGGKDPWGSLAVDL